MNGNREMKLSQFKFKLPEELIAQYPSPERDEARLMVVDRKTGGIEHKVFKEVLDYFDEGDLLVFNDTKVFPALLYGNKEKTGARIEVFLLRELNEENKLWDVLVEPARKIRIGNKLYFGEDESMVAEVIDNTTSRGRTLRFLYDGSHEEFKEAFKSAVDGDTIVLTQSIPDGDGVIFPADKFTDKGITIDLNGFTYSAKQNPAGSTGTKSQAFQLLKGNKITFKNGTLDIAEDATPGAFKMIIQNYSDTTLDNVTVDGTNLATGNNYTVSNNFGNSVYKNNTKIVTADKGDFAFDVYYWPSNGYVDGVTVTIEDDSVVIDGKVQYAHDGQGKDDFMAKTALVVPAGYETKLKLDVTDYSTSYDYTWVDVEDKAGYKKVALVENAEE